MERELGERITKGGWERGAPACLRRFAAALIAVLFSAPASAQFRFTQFSTANGLPQNTVSAIAQTSDGFLWFATYDGLVRHDGIQFTILDKGSAEGLTSNWIQSLESDAGNTLWIGTVDGGVVHYRNGVWTPISDPMLTPDKSVLYMRCGLPGGPVFSTQGKLLRWDERNSSAREIDEQGTHEFIDRFGAHWTWTEAEIRRTHLAIDRTFPLQTTLVGFYCHRFVDRRGALWLRHPEAGVYCIQQDRLTHWNAAEGKPIVSPLRVAGEDPLGNLWLFGESGVYRFESDRLIEVRPEHENGFGHVRCVHIDRDGVVWVGTNDRGLFRVDRRFLTTLTTNDGLLDDNVYPTLADRKGRVWLGGGAGISICEPDGIRSRKLIAGDAASNIRPQLAPANDPRRGVSVRSIMEDRDGRIWLGHNHGLAVLDREELTDRSAAVQHSAVDALIQCQDGGIWAGTGSGLYRIEGGPPLHLQVKDGLPDRRVTALREDSSGRIWVGTRLGLCRIAGAAIEPVGKGEILASARIRCLYEEPADVLWVGTFDRGLWRIDGEKLTAFTTRNGLFNNGVFTILDDGRGHFWMSCNRGVYRVRKEQLEEAALGRSTVIHCVAFGIADGMMSNECNGERHPAGAKTPDGRLWFPTQRGAAVVDPSLIPVNQLPPAVTIESAFVDRRKVEVGNRVEIRPGQTDLEINYTAPSSFKAEHILFRYRLEGLSDEWVEAGARRSIHYSHLPHGDYTFRVIAANGDGQWNYRGATLDVTVQPRFYQTRWFVAACIVGGAGVVYGFNAIRMRVLRSRTEKLQRLIAEQTADLRKYAQQLEEANRKLEELATKDGLTNVANHRRFVEWLEQEWQRALRNRRPISLLMIDVDYFKNYNDAYGHQRGDECLKRIADALEESANRVTDLSARYGGEEFAVVLGDTALEGAVAVAEMIRSRVEAMRIPHAQAKASPFVTVSIGVASALPEPGSDPKSLIAEADRMLYRAKELGRNRCIAAGAEADAPTPQ